LNAIMPDRVIEEKPVAAGVVHRYVTQDPGKQRGCFFPWRRAMAHKDGRRRRETQQRRHRVEVMVPVNYFRGVRDGVKVIDDLRSGSADISSHFTKSRTISDGFVPLLQQTKRQVANV
jgi:hypothetical protein